RSGSETPVGPMRGSVAAEEDGEEFPEGHDWYGQVLQWRTWLWLHQARRRRPRCVRPHHRGGAGGIEGPDRRTADHFRGRTGQEGQGPQGGQSGDFVLEHDFIVMPDGHRRAEATPSLERPGPAMTKNIRCKRAKKFRPRKAAGSLRSRYFLVAIRSDN